MLKNARRIAKAMCRALVDLLALASLLPALGMSFTLYRITLLIVLYLLKDVSVRHLGAIVDAIKCAIADLRAFQFGGLKQWFFAQLDSIKAEASRITVNFLTWINVQIEKLIADLGPDANIGLRMLNA